MGFNCGIVGLPNVGKSTLFNALASAHVPAENFPFCTTDHNTGIVHVPDARLDFIGNVFKPERLVHTSIEFVDIAGLVKDAHNGEGLGNKFLGHIRNVDAIAHVVRCFPGGDVVHPYGDLDPKRDAEVVNTELLLSDLDIVEKRVSSLKHTVKTGKKEDQKALDACQRLEKALAEGQFASTVHLSDEEHMLVGDMALITLKPMFYVANAGDSDYTKPSDTTKALIEFAKGEKRECVIIAGKLEAEISELSPEERLEFLKDYGHSKSSLEEIISTGYKILNLVTFFTKDGPEVRAWTVKSGTKAPQAAGKIHSDFEKKFIRAEVYTYDDLVHFGNEHELKAKGKLRIEGHDYVVNDGDIIHFRCG